MTNYSAPWSVPHLDVTNFFHGREAEIGPSRHIGRFRSEKNIVAFVTYGGRICIAPKVKSVLRTLRSSGFRELKNLPFPVACYALEKNPNDGQGAASMQRVRTERSLPGVPFSGGIPDADYVRSRDCSQYLKLRDFFDRAYDVLTARPAKQGVVVPLAPAAHTAYRPAHASSVHQPRSFGEPRQRHAL